VCQFIDAYDTPWIDKSLLSLSEIDIVLRDVRGFLLLVPFERHADKVPDILRFINILLQMFLRLRDVSLAIRERTDCCLPERNADVFANPPGQIAVGGAGENF